MHTCTLKSNFLSSVLLSPNWDPGFNQRGFDVRWRDPDRLTSGWWQQSVPPSAWQQRWNATVTYCSGVFMAYVKAIFSVWIRSVREEKVQSGSFSAQCLTGSVWQPMAAGLHHRWDIHQLSASFCCSTMASFSLYGVTIPSLWLSLLSAWSGWMLLLWSQASRHLLMKSLHCFYVLLLLPQTGSWTQMKLVQKRTKAHQLMVDWLNRSSQIAVALSDYLNVGSWQKIWSEKPPRHGVVDSLCHSYDFFLS